MWRGAIFNERLRPFVRESNGYWVEQVAGIIRQGWEDGSIPEREGDPVDAAFRLTALVDGLGLQVLTGITDDRRAGELIRGGLALEFGMNHKEARR